MDTAPVPPLPIIADIQSSAVSWPAICAGAAVAAALGLVLLALGVGFGLSALSPWSGEGLSRNELSALTIGWIIVMQIVSAGMGGYLAGRLRTRWLRIHVDEVHFRDTAHGFLAWALATIVTAAFLASAAASVAGWSARIGGGNDSKSSAINPVGYYVDLLFRPGGALHNTGLVTDAARAEAARTLANVLASPEPAAGDRTYLAQMVAPRTGLGPAESSARVDEVLTQARAELDAARRTAARGALWTFLALLIGAFCSSLAATVGGRQRDHVVAG